MKASNTVPVMIAAVVAAAIMYPREESMIPAIPDANEASVMLNKENTENTATQIIRNDQRRVGTKDGIGGNDHEIHDRHASGQ